MLTDLYRRHTKKCPHRAEGIGFSRCSCPVYVDSKHPVTGRRLRRSVGTRDWARAQRIFERWETDQLTPDRGGPRIPTIPEAIEKYLHDCRVRRLASSTLKSYAKALKHFAHIVKVPVEDIDVPVMTAWRNTRAAAPGVRALTVTTHTLRKEIEYLRAFCEFLVSQGHLKTNPARKVRAPRNEDPPTMPFTVAEVKKIIAACDQIDNANPTWIERARIRARALVLLLLYSGMRISDAVKLERWRVEPDGRLMARQMKTGGWLYVRLPQDAMEALGRIPVEGKHFFWSGKAKLSTAVGSARRTIDCLMRMAGIEGHPHRFRDTFSVELLKSDATSLRTVQLLLGHSSIKTTERHYAPWVMEFQRQLDDATARLKFG